MNHELTSKLYSTYLSFLPEDDFAYNLKVNKDERGSLAEFLKSPAIGQIFISRTVPGVTRGNHYHNSKVEKFFVVEGKGVIRFRSVLNSEVLEYPVDGRDFRVVDIPPGYTHSIENVGEGEMIVLFWTGEIFDAQRPETNYLPVIE
jgi:UDP-2-acetamido-2,6-beta-L-arabino-hexul-4-ose reductase